MLLRPDVDGIADKGCGAIGAISSVSGESLQPQQQQQQQQQQQLRLQALLGHPVSRGSFLSSLSSPLTSVPRSSGDVIVIPASSFSQSLTAVETTDAAAQTQQSPWDALEMEMALDDTCLPLRPSGVDAAAASDSQATASTYVGKHSVFHVHEEMVRMLAPAALLVAYRAAMHVVGDSPVQAPLQLFIQGDIDRMVAEADSSKASLQEIVTDLVAQTEQQLHSVSLCASSFQIEPHDPLYDAVVCVSDIWREKLALEQSYITSLYNDRLDVLARAEADREELLQSVTEQVVLAWAELCRSTEVRLLRCSVVVTPHESTGM